MMKAISIRRLLFALSGRLPCRLINDGERPYLERYYVGRMFGWTFYLHRFVGSDPDRGLHDHPWSRAYSFVLAGRYIEKTRSGDRWVRWFNRLTGDTFHGVEPPAGWREATPSDIRAAAGGEYPHIVFMSAPCKGFSGLLSENRSRTAKYQALNRLTVRGVWLMLEAFADEPPEMIVFENVPRIANRGRHLLDQIGELLRHYSYAVAETTHDCGELGGLAQSRKRFLLVARHIEKVPPFLYEPEKKRLQAVGTVLDRMPLPGDPAGGPMHRVPSLQWKTWVRLAFVEAGGDWRSLNRLAVENGHLKDYLIVPEYRTGYLGVHRWGDPCGTVQGQSLPSNGAFSVADPRFEQSARWNDGQAYGVLGWDEATGAIAGQQGPGQGAYSVADPRIEGVRNNNVFRIVAWDQSAQAVTAGGHPSSAGQAVADPRTGWPAGAHQSKLAVQKWDGPSKTVTGSDRVGSGALCVADPRPGLERGAGDNYLTGGHYGVVPWESSCGAVSAAACHDNGRWSVADPRGSGFSTGNEGMPAPADKLIAVIRALDDTWHRPFTTLELAALQSLVDPEEYLELDGLSDSDWRERIGNAVPPDAATAIAGVMGTTLLLAWSGGTFMRPVAVALTVAQGSAR